MNYSSMKNIAHMETVHSTFTVDKYRLKDERAKCDTRECLRENMSLNKYHFVYGLHKALFLQMKANAYA